VAYATVLHETGADGVDFDFESPDPAGKLSIALVKFAKDLKAYMAKTYNKKIYFSITPLSGDSYADQYVGIYDSLQSNDCPFDYAIPMLYNGGQYPYGDQIGEDFTWNGLLDNWRNKFMKPSANKNTKLIAAFIEYQANETTTTKPGEAPPKYQKQATFNCSDLRIFLDKYILSTPADGGATVDGAAFFYYSTDYNITILNQNVSKMMNCVKNNQCAFTC
jgi:hypothetical protein